MKISKTIAGWLLAWKGRISSKIYTKTSSPPLVGSRSSFGPSPRRLVGSGSYRARNERLITSAIQPFPVAGVLCNMTPDSHSQPRSTPNQEELTLLTGCLAGDRRAQKALYDRYKDAMYTLAYRITGDFEQAHDVLQEAFVAVFRGLDRFRRESTLGAWIKTIVVRTAYKKLRREPLMEPLAEHHTRELIDWGDYLDATYLEQAIQALPPGYRSVFVLVEIEGYAHKEVAELLGVSVGTSKSQLYHAKRQLQRTIQALGLRA